MIPKQSKNLKRRYHRLDEKTVSRWDRDMWSIERNNGIGASEASGVIDCNRYVTPYRIFRRKLGMDKPLEESWAMQQGHIFEKHIAELFEEEMGYEVIGLRTMKVHKVDWLAVDNEKPFLRVSPDWIYWGGDKKKNEQNKAILECKTSRNDYSPEDLAKPDKCFSWIVQVQYQMHVMGYKDAYIGFLNVENGKHWFEYVKYDENFCNNVLIPALEDLWNNHIVPAREYVASHKSCSMEELEQFAPDMVDADDISLRYPKQTEGKVLPLGEQVDNLSIYYQLRQQKKTIEDEMKKYEDGWKVLLADAEGLSLEGKAVITFKANKSSMKFDEKKFAADCPDQYEQYLYEKPGARVLRIK